MKILRATRIEQCIGCFSCSLACARLVHGQLSWNNAGIAIRSSGGMSTGFEARICVACDPAPCATACPTGALTQRKGGGVKVKYDLCIRCGQCAKACPVDAIHLGYEDNLPYLCIHCGRCTKFCPQNCLELVDAPAYHEKPSCALGEEEVGAAEDRNDGEQTGDAGHDAKEGRDD